MQDTVQAALEESGGYVNPLMTVVEQPYIAAFYDFENRSLGECQAEDKRLTEKLRQVAKQGTDDAGNFDAGKVSEFAGSPKERGEKMVELHSRVCGVRAAMRPKLESERKSKAVEKAVENGNFPFDPSLEQGHGMSGIISPTLNQIQLFSGVKAQLQAAGMDFNEDLRDKINAGRHITHEWKAPVDIEGADFMRQVFGATFKLEHYEPYPVRMPGYVPTRLTPLQITNLIPVNMTAKDSVKWMEETTYTSAAVETDEDANSPESSLGVTEREVTIRRISHYIPVTEEVWDDEPMMRTYINRRIPLAVLQRLDSQIVNGNGTSPNLTGILGHYTKASVGNANNSVQRLKLTHGSGSQTTIGSVAKPWNILLDAVFSIADWGYGTEGMQMANYAILTPNLYKAMLKSESSSGGYYTGGPQTPMLMSPWGVMVVLTNHLSDSVSTGNPLANQNFSGIVGDFSEQFISLFMRHDVRVEMGYIGDDFRRFRFSIRGSVRCALALFRPQAFLGIVNYKADGTAPTG